MLDPNRALVLFSGGQDSTVCLAWALDRFAHVETIGFDYRQRHAVELDCRGAVRDALPGVAAGWGDKLGSDHMVDLGVLGAVSETALTRETEIAVAANGLPNTFVPGRNLVFLAFAAAIASSCSSTTRPSQTPAPAAAPPRAPRCRVVQQHAVVRRRRGGKVPKLTS